MKKVLKPFLNGTDGNFKQALNRFLGSKEELRDLFEVLNAKQNTWVFDFDVYGQPIRISKWSQLSMF